MTNSVMMMEVVFGIMMMTMMNTIIIMGQANMALAV